jgi:hypothetical protein
MRAASFCACCGLADEGARVGKEVSSVQGIDLTPIGLFLSAGLVGKFVMGVLFLASLWCWVLIIEGVISVVRLGRAVRAARSKQSRSPATRRRGAEFRAKPSAN